MILLSRLVHLVSGWSRNMFYAVFLTTLPMILREHIDTYLGNKSEILLREAVIFLLLIDHLYPMVFRITNNIKLYASLPTREFREHLIDLHDLRLDFVNLNIRGNIDICCRRFTPYKYALLLRKHDLLFSRTVFRSVAAMNSLLQLRLQGIETFLDDEEYTDVYDYIRQLRMANRRYVLDQLIIPDEVFN